MGLPGNVERLRLKCTGVVFQRNRAAGDGAPARTPVADHAQPLTNDAAPLVCGVRVVSSFGLLCANNIQELNQRIQA